MFCTVEKNALLVEKLMNYLVLCSLLLLLLLLLCRLGKKGPIQQEMKLERNKNNYQKMDDVTI